MTDAIAEYVDNSLEQLSDKSQGRVAVEIVSDGAGFNAVIRDNGGGCAESNALRFIQPGNTGTSSSSTGISRFGMGGKTAGLSVARQVRVFSRTTGESGFMVILDKYELLQKDDWSFKVYAIPTSVRLESGETLVELRGLGSEAHAQRERLRGRFGDRYSVLLSRSPSLKLTVNGAPVTPKDPLGLMLSGHEAPPGCSPKTSTSDEFLFIPGETGKREKVRFEIVVGLGPEGSTTPDKGARIYCNGRSVGELTPLGMVGSEDDSLHTTSEYTWLRAIARLSGPAELMPWTNRKDKLDPSTPTYSTLEVKLKSAYATFIEAAIIPARQSLRERRGRGGRFPKVSEVLEDFWRTQMASGALNPKTARTLLADAPTFQKATRPYNGEEGPTGPSKKGRGIERLQADVDGDDVSTAKDLIAEFFAKPEPTNADVVRYAVDHFIDCLSNRRQSTTSSASERGNISEG